MTERELRDEVARRQSVGQRHMVLVVRRRTEPKGARVRVLPGVTGRMVGYEGGDVIVDVELDRIAKFLRRLDYSRSKRAGRA